MTQHSINEVRATLKYGRAINKRQFVGSIIGAILIPPCIIGFLMILEGIYLSIFMVVVFAFGDVMFIRILRKWHNERPYIKQCLEDAVEVVVNCKEDKSNPKCSNTIKVKLLLNSPTTTKKLF